MAVLPSRRLVRRLLVVGSVATLAVTTFLMSGLMGDAAVGNAERAARPRKPPRLVAQATLSTDYGEPVPGHPRQDRLLSLILDDRGSADADPAPAAA